MEATESCLKNDLRGMDADEDKITVRALDLCDAGSVAGFRITETVCGFEKPRLIAWQKKFGALWLLHAVREQHLRPVGESGCSYHNTDRLTGVLAPMVVVCFGGYMRRGFDAVAAGLKAYVETRNPGTS